MHEAFGDNDLNHTLLDEIIINNVYKQEQNDDYDSFKKRVKGLKEAHESLDIQISNPTKDIFFSLFAFQELIDGAKQSLDIFISDFVIDFLDSIYVIYYLENWLEADKNRKIRVLLKNEVDLKQKNFNYLLNSFPSQITVKLSNLSGISDCYRDCLIFDEKGYFASEKSQDEDVALFNFNAPSEASKLKALFNLVYSERISEKFSEEDRCEKILSDIQNEISSLLNSGNNKTISPYFEPIVVHG